MLRNYSLPIDDIKVDSNGNTPVKCHRVIVSTTSTTSTTTTTTATTLSTTIANITTTSTDATRYGLKSVTAELQSQTEGRHDNGAVSGTASKWLAMLISVFLLSIG